MARAPNHVSGLLTQHSVHNTRAARGEARQTQLQTVFLALLQGAFPAAQLKQLGRDTWCNWMGRSLGQKNQHFGALRMGRRQPV